MKLIHLNVESFKYFDALVDFLDVEKPDILALVEASDGSFFGTEGGNRHDYIGELCERFSWNHIFHPTVFRDCGEYRIGWGAAVFSQLPIALEKAMYFGQQEPTVLPSSHITFSDKPKYERYPHAWKFNLPFLSTKITTQSGDMRLMVGHFHVSYDCLETLQIWQDAERVVNYLESVDGIPTIFTGDLNIRNESMAIKALSDSMNQESHEFKNTLCTSIHPIFKQRPEHLGLGIDHIFTRDAIASSCEVRNDALVSDHLPLVLDFSL